MSRLDGWAARLALQRLQRLRGPGLVVELPDGSQRLFGRDAAPGERPPTATVHDLAVFRRLLLAGETGLGETYVEGLWDSTDLVALLSVGARERAALGFNDAPMALIARLRARLSHRANRPASARVSRRNVVAHYDHGNEFYRLWLDESMTYSCAVFESPAQTLEDAQRHKHRLLADKAGLAAGDRVLDIGCGWGAFARLAASEYGCHVTGITLSRPQLDEAVARAEREGLADRVQIELRDYRQVTGTFDKVVSIGMFEHVGAAWWETFFGRCFTLLPPGGRLVLQTITLPDASLAAHLANAGWIQRYIFPGASLPSVAAIERAATLGGFQIVHLEDIGSHYATTLHHWRERFHLSLEAVRGLGCDTAFIRRWDYYLALSEAGFRTRTTSDVQVVLERNCQPPAARAR